MNFVNKNTHELKVGDVVFNYGGAFELLHRQVFPMREKDCPKTQGDCIVFTTKPVYSTAFGEFCNDPDGFTVQGNKLAIWAVIQAE